MSYLGIGTKYPNHNLEIDGEFFISNVEMGSTNQGVPFEIYSDYTNKSFLTNSRQFRTRITPFNRPDYTYHINMGIENQTGNTFFISNPAFNETIIGDKIIKIDDQKNTILEPNILYSQAITCSNVYQQTIEHPTVIGDFTVIGLDENFKQVKIKKCIAGRYSVHCLGTDNAIYAGGYNDVGQLGLGRVSAFENTFSAALGPASSNVIEMSVASKHSIILKDDGSLYAVGDNSYKQLGIKNFNDSFSTVYIRTGLEFDLGSIQAIATSGGSTMILTKDNKVYGVGDNIYGQLGLGYTSVSVTTFTAAIGAGASDVMKISMGIDSAYIIKNDGSLWGTGANRHGQLGLGYTSSSVTTFTAAIGAGTSGVIDVSSEEDMWRGISSFLIPPGSTIILKNDGSVWGAGRNQYGQLGLGYKSSNETTFMPTIGAGASDVKKIHMGRNYSLILKNDGSVWGTGDNPYGQLGLGDGAPNNVSTFTPAIGEATSGVTDISGSIYESAVLKDNIPYFCGINYRNYLGGNQEYFREFTKQYIDASIRNVIYSKNLIYDSGNYLKVEDKSNSILKKIKEISSGFGHVMVLTEDNMLYGMGANDYGQLGLKRYVYGVPELTYIRNNVSNVSCGESFTMIIDSSGTVSGTGDNSKGQLGLESTSSKVSFTSNLTPVTASMISCGGSHTMILGTNNSLSGTGRNNYGQLGNGTTTDTSVFTEITTPVQVKTISCGGTHTMMIGTNNYVYGTGRNSYGQLGIGNTSDKMSFTQTEPIIYADAISTGKETSVVISNGNVSGTGDNFIGQLGLGAINSVSIFTHLPNNITPIKHVSCGNNFTVLDNDNGKIEISGFTTNFGTNSKQFIELAQTEISDVFDLTETTSIRINQGNNFGVIGQNTSGLMYIGVEDATQSSNTYVTINNTGTFTATSFLSFTGAHSGKINEIPEEGMIVSVNDSRVYTMNDVISDVIVSKIHKDPNVFGVSRGDGLFNAVGEGAIWVCDANGSLTSGDYIVSSTLSGYGVRQEGTRKANYTVAKILQDCNFEGNNTRYLSMSEENSLSTISKEQYLTDTGNVYKASFVGCTYHCG